MRSYLSNETQEDKDLMASLLVGGGVTAIGSGITAKEMADIEKKQLLARKKRSYVDFLKSLEPGDIIFQRNTRGGDKSMGILQGDVLQPVLGSKETHASLFLGKGKIAQALGLGTEAEINNLKSWVPDTETYAYRPDVDKSIKKKAVEFGKKAKGVKYKDAKDLIRHGISAIGLGGKKACRNVDGNMVCTNIITNAYPEIFDKADIGIHEMKKNPKLKLVSKYGNIKQAETVEHALSRGAGSVLRNLKYGLGAGALLYGGLKAREYLQGDEEDSKKSKLSALLNKET